MTIAEVHENPGSRGATHRTLRSCSVCGSIQGVELGRLKYALLDGSPLADEYSVVCCSHCGFVFCDTTSSQRDYDRFYDEYYYSPAYLAHRILPAEEQYFADIVSTVSPYMDQGRKSLFDIGCGTGNFLKACRLKGHTNLHAIDPSVSCIELLAQAGFHSAVGSVSHIPFPEVNPGVIVLSHIVEHILDMSAALRSVRSRLTGGGVVYVEVPDAARYEEFDADAPLRYFYLQHVIHFDAIHLDNLFGAHGFRKIAGGQRVRIENELTMPAVWALYEPGTSGDTSFVADFQLAEKVKSWLDARVVDPQGTFAKLAQDRTRVYVWGLGIHVQMMLGMSPLRDCHIVCCVDQDAKLQQKTLLGRKIVSPHVLSEATDEDTVVIGSLIHRQKMLKHLRENVGFRGRVVGLF